MDTDVKPPRVLVKQPELDGSTYKELVYEELAYADLETCTELEAVVVNKVSQTCLITLEHLNIFW